MKLDDHAFDDQANVEAILARLVGFETAADQAFDPPYSTLHIGSIQSGDALNLVPDRATLAFEIRLLPGADVAPLLRSIDEMIATEASRLRSKAAEAEITVEELARYPGLAAQTDKAVLAAVAAWAQDEQPPVPLSFGTEAGLYAEIGIPTLVCGPRDIARAHKADEWIGRDELAAACAMMRRLAASCRFPAAHWLR